MQYQDRLMSLVGVVGLAAIGAVQVGAQATDQEQSYRLVAIDGQSLPVVVETEDDCREEVTEATLTLRDNNEWLLEIGEREVCGDAVEDEEMEEEEGTYAKDGDTIRFSGDDESDDEDTAEDEDEAEEEDEVELDDLTVGTVSADGLSVRLADGQTVAVFRP